MGQARVPLKRGEVAGEAELAPGSMGTQVAASFEDEDPGVSRGAGEAAKLGPR